IKSTSSTQGSRLSGPGATSISGPISPPLPGALGATPIQRTAPPKLPRLQTFYAIVQYDFTAERPDELDARAGEPLTVVAQSNREWFVAKPIGRLGGAGLIPAAFVEIRDPATGKAIPDVDRLIERGDLPRVEEWKRRTSEYKASSIPLGVLDDPVPPVPAGRGQAHAQGHLSGAGLSEQSSPPALDPSSGSSSMEDSRQSQHDVALLPFGQLISASVPSFHFESEEYWFRINARYAPYPPHDRAPAPPPRELVLYRVYDDFYEFQIALLDALPIEAGRQTPNGTPIPTPGPDEPPPDRLLPYMPGPLSYVDDSITTIRCKELDEYVGNLCDLNSRGATHVLAHPLVRRFFSPRVGDTMDEVAVEPGHYGMSEAYSDGQTVGDQAETVANQFAHMGVHDRTSGYQHSQHGRTHSRSHSRAQSQSQSRSQSQVGRYSEYDPAGQLMSPPLPTASSGTSGGGTSNPAFIKVKIFHRSTDDLIAIRVPPN
ncbi:bud emergence protein 1, partial [Ceratobasidium sp. 428]